MKKLVVIVVSLLVGFFGTMIYVESTPKSSVPPDCKCGDKCECKLEKCLCVKSKWTEKE